MSPPGDSPHSSSSHTKPSHSWSHFQSRPPSTGDICNCPCSHLSQRAMREVRVENNDGCPVTTVTDSAFIICCSEGTDAGRLSLCLTSTPVLPSLVPHCPLLDARTSNSNPASLLACFEAGSPYNAKSECSNYDQHLIPQTFWCWSWSN